MSNIAYAELSLIVDFMYTGEVAVEQDQLSKLLEAAHLLKIKGLYENETEAVPATKIPDETGAKEEDIRLLEEKEKEVQK